MLEFVPRPLVDTSALGIVFLSAFEPEVIELHAEVLPKSSSEGQVGFPSGLCSLFGWLQSLFDVQGSEGWAGQDAGKTSCPFPLFAQVPVRAVMLIR